MAGFEIFTKRSFQQTYAGKPFSGWSGVVPWKQNATVQQHMTALGHVGDIADKRVANSERKGMFKPDPKRRGVWSGSL